MNLMKKQEVPRDLRYLTDDETVWAGVHPFRVRVYRRKHACPVTLISSVDREPAPYRLALTRLVNKVWTDMLGREQNASANIYVLSNHEGFMVSFAERGLIVNAVIVELVGRYNGRLNLRKAVMGEAVRWSMLRQVIWPCEPFENEGDE